MAYQFWKSGLLGHDFLYRQFATRMDGAHAVGDDQRHVARGHRRIPQFGDAAATYNVIDVRQSYLQKLLKQALAAIGHPPEADRLTHFSYEMVALSHATAKELGFAPDPDSEEAKKPFVEVSGRKGLGVKADDLIDRVIEKALVEVDRRQSELPAAERRKIAEQIGDRRGALLPDQVFAHQGDRLRHRRGAQLRRRKRARTCSTRVVRANNIFQKLQRAARPRRSARCSRRCRRLPPDADRTRTMSSGRSSSKPRVSTMSSSRWCGRSSSRCSPSTVSGWRSSSTRSTIARQILNEERDDVRRWRAAAVAYYRQQLTRVLDLMGVAVPARM